MKSISSSRVIRAAILAVAAAALSACNTVKGAGEDLKSAGEAGERVITGDSK